MLAVKVMDPSANAHLSVCEKEDRIACNSEGGCGGGGGGGGGGGARCAAAN